MPIVYVTMAVSLFFHPLALWGCIAWLGFAGAPAATVLSQWALFGLTVAYLRLWRPYQPDTFAGFQVGHPLSYSFP